MKKIIFTVEVTDRETYDAYHETHIDLIAADFIENPRSWLTDAKVKARVLK